MSLSSVRLYVAQQLEVIAIQSPNTRAITAFSSNGGKPPERSPQANELPAALLFRGPGTWARRNTGSSGAHRQTWELRIEVILARKGPGIGSAIDRLEPFFLAIPNHFEQDILLGGAVLTSRILGDGGEVDLAWGGGDYLGAVFNMSIVEDVILNRG